MFSNGDIIEINLRNFEGETRIIFRNIFYQKSPKKLSFLKYLTFLLESTRIEFSNSLSRFFQNN